MLDKELQHLFDRVYHGSVNFLTPEIFEYGRSVTDDNLIYELSEGEGLIRGTTIVGITVVEHDPYTGEVTKRDDLSQSLSDTNRAMARTRARKIAYNLGG